MESSEKVFAEDLYEMFSTLYKKEKLQSTFGVILYKHLPKARLDLKI